MDNGDSSFYLRGAWSSASHPMARDGDLNYALPSGESGHHAIWSMAAAPGLYRVSATWVPDPVYRASNARYTVNDGPGRGEFSVDQRVPPNDFSDAGSMWEELGVVPVSGALGISVVLWPEDSNGYVIADAVRIERVGDLPPGPILFVSDLSYDPSPVDFGVVELNHAVIRGFSISNLGSQPLTLSPMSAPPGCSANVPRHGVQRSGLLVER